MTVNPPHSGRDETPASLRLDGWALLNGQFTYLDGTLARAAFDITIRVRSEDQARSHLPHTDTVPDLAHQNLERYAHRGFEGWCLYSETEQARERMPSRAAREFNALLQRATIFPTRSGKKFRARHNENDPSAPGRATGVKPNETTK